MFTTSSLLLSVLVPLHSFICLTIPQVVNPSDQDALVEVEQMGLGDWPSASIDTIK